MRDQATRNRRSTRGVYAAVCTPLADDFSVDMPALLAHARWLLANGCDGLGVLGTTGEANSLSLNARRRLLDDIVAAGISAETLLPGTGTCSLEDTVELTRHALGLGVREVLVLPPFYYKPADVDGLFAYYRTLIERVNDDRLNVFLYHVPQFTGVPISLELLHRLITAFPQTIAGVKDSAGNWENMREMRERFPQLDIYSGTEKFLWQLLKIGGAGCFTATGNVICDLSAQLLAQPDGADAARLDARLNEARGVFETVPLIAGLKEVLALRTGNPVWRRLLPPQVALAGAQARDFARKVEALGLLTPAPA